MTLQVPLLSNEELEFEDENCSVASFRTMVDAETRRLTDLCDTWEKKLEKNQEHISDITEGEIRCVIGQGRLVMAERFNQFSGLVDNCEFKQGEKETTCMDLKGFWEMIYFQVEDVDKKFAKLAKIENNNWIEDDEAIVSEKVSKTMTNSVGGVSIASEKGLKTRSNSVGGVARKRAALVAKKVASAGLKALIAAKRKKVNALEDVSNEGGKEDFKENVDVDIIVDKASDDSALLISPEKTFDGGFFSVKSPVRHIMKSPKTSQSTGCDKLRKAVLTDSAKRVSGLVSPFVSQVARRAMVQEKVSPSKDSRRSSLFDDDFDQDDEI